jgi:hypothetical protein
MSANFLHALVVFRHQGSWVFDDPAVGLDKEPFVCGIDDMIDRLVREIPGAARGFRLLFSPAPFPGYAAKLEWRREEHGGNWYHSPTFGFEGWLCPALFKYFQTAPRELYAKAEPCRRILMRRRASLRSCRLLSAAINSANLHPA